MNILVLLRCSLQKGVSAVTSGKKRNETLTILPRSVKHTSSSEPDINYFLHYKGKSGRWMGWFASGLLIDRCPARGNQYHQKKRNIGTKEKEHRNGTKAICGYCHSSEKGSKFLKLCLFLSCFIGLLKQKQQQKEQHMRRKEKNWGAEYTN